MRLRSVIPLGLLLIALVTACKKDDGDSSKPLSLPEIKRSDRYLEFKPIIVNMNENYMSYLRVDVGFMLAHDVTEGDKALRLKARDRIIVYLSGLKAEQLADKAAQKKAEKELIKIGQKVYGKRNVTQVIVTRWQTR
jgi:flagellar basal body-associated protein FliL